MGRKVILCGITSKNILRIGRKYYFWDMKEAYNFNKWGNKPEKVVIEKETNDYVWMGGRRSKKNTNYEAYFETIAEGKNWLLSLAQLEIDRARDSLRYYEDQKHKLIEKMDKWDI